jgi:proteasome activator subunit 4
VQPLVDFVVSEFNSVDFNGEFSFDVVKVLCLFRAFYEELGWPSAAWMDAALTRAWPEITGEHDDVRAYIAELLAFSAKVKWRPKPSVPTAEKFIIESRTGNSSDIMGIQDGYHAARISELLKKFPVWREERLPGVRAFQSTYDKYVRLVHDCVLMSTNVDSPGSVLQRADGFT